MNELLTTPNVLIINKYFNLVNNMFCFYVFRSTY